VDPGCGCTAEAKYKEQGTVLAEDQLLDMFKTNLEEFASKHKQETRQNPEFRVQFQDMCVTIGVDPLASGKGFWSEMLGVGDFYYELCVQIIEVCLALKYRNGGLITLEELHQQVLKGKNGHARVSSYCKQTPDVCATLCMWLMWVLVNQKHRSFGFASKHLNC
uniref:Vacuolar-sorting protein SNF8 n=1 Tax=Jaculus jaculus TaxID=51337 RepID=A0A8C5K3C6_JACJA